MTDKQHDDEFDAGWVEAAELDPTVDDLNVDEREINRREPSDA